MQIGLTEQQAQQRLAQQGENRLAAAKRKRPLSIFLGQFRDVMVLILLAATVISALLGEITDAVTIILIVLLNAVLGFVQEYRTERTLEALSAMTAPTARVFRDGTLTARPAAELVNGDVIRVEAGDRVPADCRILRCRGLFAEESVATGGIGQQLCTALQAAGWQGRFILRGVDNTHLLHATVPQLRRDQGLDAHTLAQDVLTRN